MKCHRVYQQRKRLPTKTDANFFLSEGEFYTLHSPKATEIPELISSEEMEILHNALQVYSVHLQGVIEAYAGKDLSRASVMSALGHKPEEGDENVKVPLNDIFIGTKVSADTLREKLVRLVGYDMTKEG